MKIISAKEYSLKDGTGKTTPIVLDQRPGIYFKIICGTWETPLFTKDQRAVPALMIHADRSQANVTLTCDGQTLNIKQGYQQATFLYLYMYVNDDWADTAELKSVYLDAKEITYITLTNGSRVRVSASLSGQGVRLTSSGFTPGSTGYTSQEITMSDGKKYIFPISWTTHQYSSDPVRYDYIYQTVNRAILGYQKPGVNPGTSDEEGEPDGPAPMTTEE